MKSLANPMKGNRFIDQSSAHISAIATLENSHDKAMETIENVAAAFGTAADDEQFLYAKTRKDWSTRHAYDSAFINLTKASLNDFAFPSDGVFDQKLWVEKVTFKVPLDQRVNFRDYFQSSSYSFWREWHQGFFEGNPLDWELQRKIALIDESIWNSGADAIAREIEQIRARWEVESALFDLRENLSIQASARHSIGGNNPPESIDDERLSGAARLIREAEKELSTALEEVNPALEQIERILEKIKAGFLAITKWIGRKADLAVDTAIVTAIKQGGPLVGGYYALDKLIKALEDWLPYLH